MTPALLISPAAELDLAEAADWYDAIGSGLSSHFIRSLDDTLRRITDHPDTYAFLARGMRRALLDRFPYGVFFRNYQRAIQVVAVLHTSRHPRVWQSRTH